MSEILPVSMQKEKESGNPFFIELYAVQLRDGLTRIAACDENIVFNGEEYIAVPFKRGEVTQSMDNLTDSCEISIGDCDDELLRFLIEGFDFRGCSAQIVRIKYPDSLENPNICQWVFGGYIDEPSFSDGTFTCKLKQRMPNIECPNRNFGLACNSEFGDADCGMDVGEETSIIMGEADNTITLEKSYEADYWKDGVISITGESRVIIKSEGNTVTLNVNFAQNSKGKQATLRRGCDKTVARCKQYSNMTHYGGFPAIPYESQYR